MGRINKMSLKAIIAETDLMLRPNDIIYISNSEKIIDKYIELCKTAVSNGNEIKKLLIENDEHIDKERFILLTVKNYKENIKMLQKYIIDLKEQHSYEKSKESFERITDMYVQLHQQKENLEKAIKLGKGIEAVYSSYYYDEKEKRYRVEVTDSRELIDGKKTNFSKALKKFDQVDLSFKGGKSEELLGMEYVLQSILLTDLYNVFPNEDMGNFIRTMILENQVISKGLKTKDQLELLKTTQTYKEYADLIDSVTFEGLFPYIKETLREYAEYIDMDKLLLISAYRFYEALENGYIKENIHNGVKEILQGILVNIKLNNSQISCELQNKKDDTYELKKITYSVKDIKKCISQFASDRYISDNEIEEYREKVNSGEVDLIDILPEHIDIIFSQEDLEKLSILSTNNLLYVFNKLEWDNYKLVEMYEANKISLENIKELRENVDLSTVIDFNKLNTYYQNTKANPENKEILSRYENYLKLYREVFINGRNDEQIEKKSSDIVEKLAEMYEKEEYEENIKNYYKQGIITLQSIADWSNESLITKMFDEGLIKIQDMNNLAQDNKISAKCLTEVYSRVINNRDIDYNERISLIRFGYVKQSQIFDLYKSNLIFEEDLRKLAEEGFVKETEMKRLINSRTLQELERNSAIVLKGLNSLTKKNNDIYYERDGIISGEHKTKSTGKFIIDPNEREKFIRMLNAYKANTDLASDSPFYNYEFYVIPDESGTIGLNSVVIAERYYEDKDTETRFAMNNATYFFKYKDLMVLSNLRKSEMTKERENVVFTGNHVMANEKREGRWATSVIACVVKTMLSSDLKEYSKANQRKIIQQKLTEIYSADELVDILSMASDIDLGEHICEIEEPTARTRFRRRETPYSYKKDDGEYR